MSQAHWQLAILIFTAFYLDHSQNEYLGTYFSMRLQQSVYKLKMCLDIVQGLLTKSELIANDYDEDDEPWAMPSSGNVSIDLGDKAETSYDDILNTDTSNWDPFRDADKFEALAIAEQNHR